MLHVEGSTFGSQLNFFWGTLRLTRPFFSG